MAYPQNNPRMGASQESLIQGLVSQHWPAAKASGNPTLYYRSQSWFPGGYDVKDGRLKYVQVQTSNSPLLNPKIAPFLVAGGTLAAGAFGGGAAGGSGASGATGGSGYLASTPLGTGYTVGAMGPTAAVSGMSAADLGMLGGAGTGTGASAVAGASGAGNAIKNWLGNNAGNLIKTGVATGLTALANRSNSNAAQMTPEQTETLRQMNEIIAEQKRRMQRQAGLSDATTDMAMGLLPTKYQR